MLRSTWLKLLLLGASMEALARSTLDLTTFQSRMPKRRRTRRVTSPISPISPTSPTSPPAAVDGAIHHGIYEPLSGTSSEESSKRHAGSAPMLPDAGPVRVLSKTDNHQG